MVNDLNRWTVGWIDWNLVLDETGGPNHVGNLCSAPILVDTANDALLHQSSYYYIGHFARFVRPGARRVLCAATRQDLEASAFVNPDGSTATARPCCPSSRPRCAWRAARSSCWSRHGARRRG
jgi:glucosylceramidase